VNPTDTSNVNATGGPEDEMPEGSDARSRSLSLGGSGGIPVGNSFGKVFGFLAAVREEMRKVTWPTRKMVVTETFVVVVVVIFFTSMIVGLDRVFAAIFNAVLFGK
jgi:preprotein translocase subunit SecE